MKAEIPFTSSSARESGFDKVAKDSVEQGVIYIGSSAGAYLTCPTIETSTWGSPIASWMWRIWLKISNREKHKKLIRKLKPKDRYGVTDLTALNLVPFVMIVHYADDMKELIKEKMKGLKYPLKILRDGQAILVQDNSYKMVGQGEEVKI